MTADTNFRVGSFITGLAIKAPVKAYSDANLTLSGEQTVNGVALVAGDRCLVRSQTNPIENGVYTCETSAWQRAADFDGTRDVVGGTIVPAYDSVQALFLLFMVNGDGSPIIPGTDSITFSFLPMAGTLTEQTNIVNALIDNSTIGDTSVYNINVQSINFDVGIFVVSGNAVAFDCAQGQVGVIDLQPASAAVALSITNVPAVSGVYYEIQMEIIQGSGLFDVTWPINVEWPDNGTAPDFTALAADRYGVVHLWTRDAGTNWRGSYTMDYA